MALGMLITVSLWVPKDGFVKAFLIGTIIIIAFGVLDDIVGIGYKGKFLGQVIAAIIVITYGRVQIITLKIVNGVERSDIPVTIVLN